MERRAGSHDALSTWPTSMIPTTMLTPDGRIMEVLSEHQCQGWLEGYLLTGRHGFFSCYEAFIHIIDSMFNQHAKWLKTSTHIPWRRPIASLNYFLSLMCGDRTTTGCAIKTLDSSITSSTRRPRSFAFTCHPTQIVCFRLLTIACEVAIMSTS